MSERLSVRRAVVLVTSAAVPSLAKAVMAGIAAVAGSAALALAAVVPVRPIGTLLTVFGYGVLWVGLGPIVLPPIQAALSCAADITIATAEKIYGSLDH